jgi:hypothetical protein
MLNLPPSTKIFLCKVVNTKARLDRAMGVRFESVHQPLPPLHKCQIEHHIRIFTNDEVRPKLYG